MPDKKPSLADRMKPRAAAPAAGSVAGYFKTPDQEHTKRLTLDLTEAQHLKLKLHAAREGMNMAALLRGYIDGLPD